MNVNPALYFAAGMGENTLPGVLTEFGSGGAAYDQGGTLYGIGVAKNSINGVYVDLTASANRDFYTAYLAVPEPATATLLAAAAAAFTLRRRRPRFAAFALDACRP